MATAFKGASFEYYGRQYQEIFARSHVELELRETAGAVENLKLLQDPNSDVQIAFVTGGLSDAKNVPGVLSLGTVYDQPFWIFYPSNQQIDQFAQLKGKRIAVGPIGSATRHTAEQVLGKGGVSSETATFLPFAGSAADKALAEGQVDAVWIIGVPEATAVQSFLRNPNVRPMSFPMSEAFTRIFPDLARMTLPQGTVDIERIIPANDVQLIGTKSKVLIRSDLHPEIVQLLLQTMKEVQWRIGSFSSQRGIPQWLRFRIHGGAYCDRFLQERSFVHAAAFAAVALRPRPKSNRRGGDWTGDRFADAPFCASGL
jgi:TRAP-type uncharacterized transport system substrate-binding protein